MAIDRNLSWVLRHGELATDTSDSYPFVGGSPIKIVSGTVSGNLGTSDMFNGIAWNSQADDEADQSLSTFILPPAIVTLKAETNGVKPWKTYGGLTWAVGDLLRPIVSTGTTCVAVWTNEVYSSEVSKAVYVYPAKIIAMEGTSSVPTSMTILVTPCLKILA